MTERDPGLAIERTALAWRRTGLAHLVTAGLLLRLLDGTWLRWVVATLLVASAGLATWAAAPVRLRIVGVTAAASAVSLLGAAGTFAT